MFRVVSSDTLPYGTGVTRPAIFMDYPEVEEVRVKRAPGCLFEKEAGVWRRDGKVRVVVIVEPRVDPEYAPGTAAEALRFWKNGDYTRIVDAPTNLMGWKKGDVFTLRDALLSEVVGAVMLLGTDGKPLCTWTKE
jgi:hypothetical protein